MVSDQGEELRMKTDCLSNPESITWRQIILWESVEILGHVILRLGWQEKRKLINCYPPPHHPHALTVVLYIYDLTLHLCTCP